MGIRQGVGTRRSSSVVQFEIEDDANLPNCSKIVRLNTWPCAAQGGHDLLPRSAGRLAGRGPHLPAARILGAGTGLPGTQLLRQSLDSFGPGHHALHAVDARQRGGRDRREPRDGRVPWRPLPAVAGRASRRARVRARDGLLRRPGPGFRRRLPERRACAVRRTRSDAAGTGCVGQHRRLGVGAQPGPGLPRNRPGHRFRARGRHGPFPARQGRAVGGRAGPAIRPG